MLLPDVAKQVEIWKDVDSSGGLYQVSNLGNVKRVSWHRKTPSGHFGSVVDRILVPTRTSKGYLYVSLHFHGMRKKYKVHRLVALHFIPLSVGKTCVNHKDGNKENNIVENLEWCTPKENTEHAIKSGIWDPYNNKLENMHKTRQKITVMLNKDNKLVRIFRSLQEADAFIGTTVYNAMRHSRLCRGFRFLFLSEYLK